MSKASEWADFYQKEPPTFSAMNCGIFYRNRVVAKASLCNEGRRHGLELNLCGIRYISGPDALSLARWILDTFGEST